MLNNWKKYKLGDVAEILMGQSPSGDTCTNNPIDGLPLLNGPTEFGYSYPTPVQYTNDSRKKSEVGDLLFCVRGSTTGKMNFSNRAYSIGRGLAAIRGKNSFSTKFVKYIIDFYLPQMLNVTTGSTFPNIGKDDLNNLEVNVPDSDTANSIAEILSSLDDKIELNLQTNKTLEEMANALYKHWFVDFGPFKNGKFIESEMGMIPEGWEVENLKTLIVDFNNKRGPISSMERVKIKGKYPYYGATGILDYVDKYALDGMYILVAEDGTVKNNTNNPYLQFIEGKFWVSNHAHIIKGNENYPDTFVYYTLQNTIVLPYITGAVQPKLSKGSLESIVILKPTSEVAFSYTKIVDEFVNAVFQNNYEIEKLKQTRDYLLPKLISGEIQVKEAAKKIRD